MKVNKKNNPKKLIKIFLLISIIVSFFIILELLSGILIRTVFIVQSDISGVSVKSKIPGLYFTGKPDFYHNSDFFHNTKGLRDFEYSLEKPLNTFRILLLGDSVAYGVGVTINKTYAKVLEKMLNNNSIIRFEVLNGGVGGYNTYQEYLWLEHIGSIYNPDMIIVGYLFNDIIVTNMIEKKSLSETKSIYSVHVEGNPFPVVVPLPRKINDFMMEKFKSYKYFNMLSYSLLTKLNREFDFYNYNDGRELTKQAVDKLKSYVIENNQSLLFVNFPILDYSRDPQEILALDILKEKQVEYLDLFSSFQSDDIRKLRIERNDVTHPNGLGHAIAANEIYNYLLNNCLIPSCKNY